MRVNGSRPSVEGFEVKGSEEGAICMRKKIGKSIREVETKKTRSERGEPLATLWARPEQHAKEYLAFVPSISPTCVNLGRNDFRPTTNKGAVRIADYRGFPTPLFGHHASISHSAVRQNRLRQKVAISH
jgi:hypothetical protein